MTEEKSEDYSITNEEEDRGKVNEDLMNDEPGTNKDEQGKTTGTGQEEPTGNTVPGVIELGRASESSVVTDSTSASSGKSSKEREKDRKIGVKNAINKWLLQVQPIVPRKMSGEKCGIIRTNQVRHHSRR